MGEVASAVQIDRHRGSLNILSWRTRRALGSGALVCVAIAGCGGADSEPVSASSSPTPAASSTTESTNYNPSRVEPNNQEAVCAGSPDISKLDLGPNQIVVDGRCDDAAPDDPVGVYPEPVQSGESLYSLTTGEVADVVCVVVRDGQPRANSQEPESPT